MVLLIANKCFVTKILFCLCDSQISGQPLNLIAKHQNSVNSKNPHMYSWKIIHGKHKRIALQSLINYLFRHCNPPYESRLAIEGNINKITGKICEFESEGEFQ